MILFPAMLRFARSSGSRAVRFWHTLALVAIVLGPMLSGCSRPDEVARAIRALKADDPGTRLQAARTLGELKDPRAVLPLTDALGDDDVQVRIHAARALGVFTDTRSIDALIVRLEDPSLEVREACAAALIRLGPPAVNPLMEVLDSRYSWVRGLSASALGRIGDGRAAQRLMATLTDEDADVRQRGAEALRQIGPQAVDGLVAAVADDRLRASIEVVLVAMGPDGVARIVEILDRQNAATQALLARVLGRIGDARAVEALVALLDAADVGTRLEAMEAVGRLKSAEAVEPLIGILVDPSPRLRRAAARALAQIRSPLAVEPLIKQLADPDLDVRAEAALALGALGDARAVEPLVTLLMGERSTSQPTDLEAPPALREPIIGPGLAERADDRLYARREAGEALIMLARPAVEPLVEAMRRASPRTREVATDVLVKIGPPADAVLNGFMQRKDLAALAATYPFFLHRGLPDAIPLLIETLQQHGDKDMVVAFIRSGDAQLDAAARRWVEERGGKITIKPHTPTR